MIVCTCDACGKVVERWNRLTVNFVELNEGREICNDCRKAVQDKFQALLDEITVTGNDNETNK